MIKWIGAALFTVILLIIQTTVLNYIEIFGVKPLLILSLVVSIALVFGYIPSLVSGVICGVLLDMISGGIFFGINTLLLTCVGILSSKFCDMVFREKVIVIIWFTFWACFFYSVMYNFSLFFLVGRMGNLGIVIQRSFIESVYTGIAVIPVFSAVKFSRRFFIDNNITKINFFK